VTRRPELGERLTIHAASRARVLAVVNQKGGVGKTTTAVNLSACFAASERATLLVDLDPQGNASSAFGVTHDVVNSTHHIYHALIGECELAAATHKTALDYLQVVPAGPDLVGAEIELVGAEHRERRLSDALEQARASYDLIVIDCPPSLGLLTLNALTAADSLVIPLQCEYYALEGLARLLETSDLVREQLNPELELEGVVLTMVDQRNNLSRQVEAEVRSHLGEKVYRTRIPRNVRLSEAPSHGMPIILYDIHSRGAVAYLKLAEEILQRLAAESSNSSTENSDTDSVGSAVGSIESHHATDAELGAGASPRGGDE
jgi:chromosome partitioning protein